MTLEETNLLYLDYNWDLDHDRIVLDQDLNIEQLGWHPGDLFRLVKVNGRHQLQRVDPLVAFCLGQSVNERQLNGHR